jgi:hypothetical protein
MTVISHQTVRLERGSHSSPEDGVCVIELSSMLAGEPLSDRPASVCPVLAQLLRTYNDGVDDERRQALYSCAALVVGSRADEDVERRRAERLREAILGGCQRRTGLKRVLLGPTMPKAAPRDCATYAARALLAESDRGLPRLLALVTELVDIGTRPSDVTGAPGAPSLDGAEPGSHGASVGAVRAAHAPTEAQGEQ